MRRPSFMLSLVVAAGSLVLAACGEEPAQDQTQIADPALGTNEAAACPDPYAYCISIGGTFNCGVDGCGSTNCPMALSVTQTNACESGGASWLVTNPAGVHPGGDYPCTTTWVGNQVRVTFPGPICQADIELLQSSCNISLCWKTHYKMCTDYHYPYQNHYVNSPGTACVGFVQCTFPSWSYGPYSKPC